MNSKWASSAGGLSSAMMEESADPPMFPGHPPPGLLPLGSASNSAPTPEPTQTKQTHSRAGRTLSQPPVSTVYPRYVGGDDGVQGQERTGNQSLGNFSSDAPVSPLPNPNTRSLPPFFSAPVSPVSPDRLSRMTSDASHIRQNSAPPQLRTIREDSSTITSILPDGPYARRDFASRVQQVGANDSNFRNLGTGITQPPAPPPQHGLTGLNTVGSPRSYNVIPPDSPNFRYPSNSSNQFGQASFGPPAEQHVGQPPSVAAPRGPFPQYSGNQQRYGGSSYYTPQPQPPPPSTVPYQFSSLPSQVPVMPPPPSMLPTSPVGGYQPYTQPLSGSRGETYPYPTPAPPPPPLKAKMQPLKPETSDTLEDLREGDFSSVDQVNPGGCGCGGILGDGESETGKSRYGPHSVRMPLEGSVNGNMIPYKPQNRGHADWMAGYGYEQRQFQGLSGLTPPKKTPEQALVDGYMSRYAPSSSLSPHDNLSNKSTSGNIPHGDFFSRHIASSAAAAYLPSPRVGSILQDDSVDTHRIKNFRDADSFSTQRPSFSSSRSTGGATAAMGMLTVSQPKKRPSALEILKAEAKEQVLSEMKQACQMRAYASKKSDVALWEKQIDFLNGCLMKLSVTESKGVAAAEASLTRYNQSDESRGVFSLEGRDASGDVRSTSPSKRSIRTAASNVWIGSESPLASRKKPRNIQKPKPPEATVRKNDNMPKYTNVKIMSPGDLPEGYTFKAKLENRVILATVPRGGVSKGEIFAVPLLQR